MICLGRDPDKWFRLFVILREIFFDGDDEFFNASEVATPQALLG